MKKAFKIIGIILGVIILIIAALSYFGWKNMQRLKLSQTKADFIIENLDDPNIAEKFPVKYFSKEQLEPILEGIRSNCDWKTRDGKFVDFFRAQTIGGTGQNSFIYEYYLKCDSLRFILSFNTESDPELTGFHIEPLEMENKMILFPEKQLKNR